MKKTIFLMLVSLFIGGCGGINCQGEPPKRATLSADNSYGMRYHYVMYEPVGNAEHTPSLKCTQYEYGKSHLYTDDLGNVNGDKIVWIASYRGQSSEMLPSDIQKKAHFIFGNQDIRISGLNGGYEYLNGIWKIEVNSPDSWNVPITGN